VIRGLRFTTKGGPGSGNVGHAGRPGSVGGSAPRGPLIQIDPKFSEGLGWSRGLLDEALEKIDKEHLKGIKEISASPPTPPGSSRTWGDYTVMTGGNTEIQPAATYDKFSKTIHVNKNYMGTIENTLVHEIGHHVSLYDGPLRSKILSRKILIKDTRDKGLVSEVWTKDKWRQIHDMTPKQLSSIGLRKYSGYSLMEFSADSYSVWKLGTAQQKTELAKFLGYESMDAVFGG